MQLWSLAATGAHPIMLHMNKVLSKDSPEKIETLETVGPFFAVLVAAWLLYMLRKDLFVDKSVAYIALAGFTFSVCSVSMHTLNKAVVSFTQMPSTVTGIQMLVAVAVMLCGNFGELRKADRGMMLRWCLVPICYAAMLNTSLIGYEYLSLTLVTVFRNLAPLVTMCVEGVIMPPEHRPTVTLPVVASILLMIAGALLFSWTETAFSWIGLGLVVVNTCIAIADRVLQRRLLVKECKDLAFPVCMIIANSLGLIPTFFLAWAQGEFQQFQRSKDNWMDPGVIVLVLMSAFMGLFIGLAGLMCQKAMSATSFQVMQNMSKVVVVFIGVELFGDKMAGACRMFGMFLSLAGSAAYGYARSLEAAEKAKANQDETQSLAKAAEKLKP